MIILTPDWIELMDERYIVEIIKSNFSKILIYSQQIAQFLY